MHELAVGEYYPGTPPYPETGEYTYSSSVGHELRLFYRRPSFSEIEDVGHGQAEFGFVVEGPIIFFLYRFGEDIPWSHAPYSWHLVPGRDRALPEAHASPESRALLSTVLVDGQSGIVQAIRTTTFAAEFGIDDLDSVGVAPCERVTDDRYVPGEAVVDALRE